MAEGLNLLGDIEQLKKQIGIENRVLAQQDQAAFNPIAAQIQAQFMDIGIDKDARIQSAKAVQKEFKSQLSKSGSLEDALNESARTMLSDGNLPAAQWLIDKAATEKARRLDLQKKQADYDKVQSAIGVDKATEKRLKAQTTHEWNKNKELLGKIKKQEQLTPLEITKAKQEIQKAELALRYQEDKQAVDLANTGAQAENTKALAAARRLRTEIVELALGEIDEFGRFTKSTQDALIAAGVLPGTSEGIAEAISEKIAPGSARPNRPRPGAVAPPPAPTPPGTAVPPPNERKIL